MRRFALLSFTFTALILGLSVVHVRADGPVQCKTYVYPDHVESYCNPVGGGVQAQPLPGVVEQAVADQVNRTCKGFCGPTQYAHPGDCRYDFSCAPSAPATAAVYPSLVKVAPAQNLAPVVAGVRILAPATGDGGLLR